MSVSWPKALFHLENNIFCNTLAASSYPQPPNLCTETVIDCAMRTWI